MIVPGDERYDEARRVWNGSIDRYPVLIARCRSEQDVIAALAYARGRGLPVAVRGGGHSLPGHSACDDGVVIDLGLMNEVRVDPQSRRAWAQGGCRLGELDRATQRYGLAVTTGAVSHTGLGGLTLGGGFGLLMRKYGLTIDSLKAARLIDAGGNLVTASEEENVDLFWAIRGGGGNFGIVTMFEFQLHSVTDLPSGVTVHTLDQAREVLSFSRNLLGEAPDDLTWGSVMRHAPELPWMPAKLVGKPVIISAFCWLGDKERRGMVASTIEQFTQMCPPEFSMSDTIPYVALQSGWDEIFPHHNHAYSKGGLLAELTNEAIDALTEHARTMPSSLSQVEVTPMGGAVSRIAPDATAFPHRQAQWVFNVIGLWTPGDKSDENVNWVRNLYRTLEAQGIHGSYVNYMHGEEMGGVVGAYGQTLQRLARIKGIYDPSNIFRFNQNILPEI
ncbi:FAD-binding oxidoreductase [Streptomyces sp. NPDC004787]|uniref:FAD-binding oxidoreductase n=1 Tax=Streptomyces sp. NPDC004787 TaxID=3154291 RepID=UPI0033A9339A